MFFDRARFYQQSCCSGQKWRQCRDCRIVARVIEVKRANQRNHKVASGGAPEIAAGKRCRIGHRAQGSLICGGQRQEQIAACAFGKGR